MERTSQPTNTMEQPGSQAPHLATQVSSSTLEGLLRRGRSTHNTEFATPNRATQATATATPLSKIQEEVFRVEDMRQLAKVCQKEITMGFGMVTQAISVDQFALDTETGAAGTDLLKKAYEALGWKDPNHREEPTQFQENPLFEPEEEPSYPKYIETARLKAMLSIRPDCVLKRSYEDLSNIPLGDNSDLLPSVPRQLEPTIELISLIEGELDLTYYPLLSFYGIEPPADLTDCYNEHRLSSTMERENVDEAQAETIIKLEDHRYSEKLKYWEGTHTTHDDGNKNYSNHPLFDDKCIRWHWSNYLSTVHGDAQKFMGKDHQSTWEKALV